MPTGTLGKEAMGEFGARQRTCVQSPPDAIAAAGYPVVGGISQTPRHYSQQADPPGAVQVADGADNGLGPPVHLLSVAVTFDIDD